MRAGRILRLLAGALSSRSAREDDRRLFAELMAWDHEPEKRRHDEAMADAKRAIESADRTLRESRDLLARAEKYVGPPE